MSSEHTATAATTPPPRLLLHGGEIYASGQQFATALLVENGVVAWAGDDDTAATLRDVVRLDLGGRLVTPGFVAAGAAAGLLPAAARLSAAGVVAADAADPGGAGAVPPRPVVAAASLTPERLAALAGPAALDLGDDPEAAIAALAAAADAGSPPPAARGHHAILRAPLSPEAAAALGRLGLPALIDAARVPTLTTLVDAGVALGLAVRPDAPWRSVGDALFADEGLSAKAAFIAATRGVWRALGRHERGTLRPGSPASLVAWAPAPLALQAADPRRAEWSLDERSGQLGLPRLEPGAAGPAAELTLVDGAPAHVAAAGWLDPLRR